MIIALIIAALVVIIDQVTKYLVVANISATADRISFIPNILDFVYVQNDGMAWGLGNEAFRWVFVAVTVVVCGVLIFLITKKDFKNIIYYLATGLIVGGGIGNMIDRIINGYVVDFLSLSFFEPVCNLADYAITVGTVLLVIFIIFFYGKNREKNIAKVKSTSENDEV